MKACSFFGHSSIEVTEELRKGLKNVIEEKITKENFGIFYFGGFGMFDNLCWEVVTELKKEYPHLRRIFCLSDERYLKESKRPKDLRKVDYEEFIYIPLAFDYWYTRIYYRNIEIINQSNFVIFFVYNSENSGAYKTYKYALNKKKDYINLSSIKKDI